MVVRNAMRWPEQTANCEQKERERQNFNLSPLFLFWRFNWVIIGGKQVFSFFPILKCIENESQQEDQIGINFLEGSL